MMKSAKLNHRVFCVYNKNTQVILPNLIVQTWSMLGANMYLIGKPWPTNNLVHVKCLDDVSEQCLLYTHGPSEVLACKLFTHQQETRNDCTKAYCAHMVHLRCLHMKCLAHEQESWNDCTNAFCPHMVHLRCLHLAGKIAMNKSVGSMNSLSCIVSVLAIDWSVLVKHALQVRSIV